MRALRIPFTLTALSCACTLQLGSIAAHAAALREELVEPQKTLESVTDTPISIKAITGEDFSSFANFNFEDITRLTPGLTVKPGITPGITLRGAGTVTSSDVSLRTNIYLDGFLVEQPRTLFDAQFDTQRYEILRGPQGTLYGKASPAGTVNIRTQEPNLRKIDGYIAASGAQHDAVNTQFGVSLPIIEGELAVRLAGVYDENKNTQQKLITTGDKALSRSKGGRVTVLWQPNEALNARLSYNYLEHASDFWQNISGAGYSADEDKVNIDFPSKITSREKLLVLNLDYALTDHLSLASMSGYENQKMGIALDTDGTLSPQGYTNGDERVDPVWQQDVRLLSQDNSFWDWQLGFYYQRRHGHAAFNAIQDFNPALPLSITFLLEPIGNREEYALYNHNTLKLTDQLNVIIGLRYQQQRANSHQPSSLNGAPAVDAIDERGRKLSDYAVTGTLKIQYFFTPDLAGYLSLDRASRAGSSNPDSTGALPDNFVKIAPETSNSAELGLKGNFWKERGRFALALYDQIYKDFQQDVSNLRIAGSPVDITVMTASAKEAQIRGAEFSLALLPLDNWEIATSLAFTDAKYKDFKNSPCNPPAGEAPPADPGYLTCDLSGERLASSSRWSGNASSTYNVPFGNGLDWYIKGLVQAQSSQVDSLTRQTLGGYSTTDFFTGFRGGSGNTWDVSLWVKNAFDRRAVTSIYQVPTSPLFNGYTFSPYQNVTTNLPRQVGITGVYRFQ